MKSRFLKKIMVLLFSFLCLFVHAQNTSTNNTKLASKAVLPPISTWHGKSESLIAKADNPWQTACEKTDFVTTPSYDETVAWLKKLDAASSLIHLISIGESPEGRAIYMVIASNELVENEAAFKQSKKPALFVQAGIHAGEIDGKDAGMMLLRDIAFGGKSKLLDQVNFLFIPILNVDGHERFSAYNRPNQRGPENMGYRTNAQNLNLNRDYAKLDTKEIRAVVNVINTYHPLLYLDVHVTDGADYQYDITFGTLGKEAYSQSINSWLETVFTPQANQDLYAMGHIPGPFINGLNWNDPSTGIIDNMNGPNFSNTYGDLRHLPTLLVENHSLKPYKQRVLGTYVLLESSLKIVALHAAALRESVLADNSVRLPKIPILWKVPQMNGPVSFENQGSIESSKSLVQAPDSIKLLGIVSQNKISPYTNSEYVEYTGKTWSGTVANYKSTEVVDWIKCPKRYWIPASNMAVIERLKLHGIKMEILTEPREVEVMMYRIQNTKFGNADGQVLPFEGRMQVKGKAVLEKHKQLFAVGSAAISTDQDLGELAMVLLEPNSPNSLFCWGFFSEIFQRTEYIEDYVMEPTIAKMLVESPELKQEFEDKKAKDAAFAKDKDAIYFWFYSKTNYYDSRYLLYPVGREE